MAKKKATKKASECKLSMCKDKCSGSGCVYVLGFLGMAAFNISTTTGFWSGILGVIKALIWPAFLVFQLFQFLA